MKRSLGKIALLLVLLLAGSASAEDKWAKQVPMLLDGMPSSWTKLRLADEFEVNGLPMLIYEITGPDNLGDAAVEIATAWTKDGWKVVSRTVGTSVDIAGVKGRWVKHCRLWSPDGGGVKGDFSMSDLPGRIAHPDNKPAPTLGGHLPKPTGTLVINEVRTVDMVGESLLTTLVDDYDIEQNVAFYEEAMVERGWKLAYKRRAADSDAIVLKYLLGDKKEATFTFTMKGRQVFIVVNWVTKST